MSEVTCSNKGCTNKFEKATHNQKYCSDDCCREATNANIKKKNADKKARMSGKKRICKNRGCGTILSRYSEEQICLFCASKGASKELSDLLEMIKHVSG